MTCNAVLFQDKRTCGLKKLNIYTYKLAWTFRIMNLKANSQYAHISHSAAMFRLPAS